MKTVAALAILLCTGLALAQEKVQGGDFKTKQPKNVKATTAPVTRAEAAKVFGKVWTAFATGLKVKGANPVKLTADNKPITKDEVLASIKSLVASTSPTFKRSASPTPFKPTRFRKDLDQVAYAKLVKDGFVMPVGPLVTGSNGPVSTFEFGDAVGVMIVRIADLAHLPSRKFSPSLMK